MFHGSLMREVFIDSFIFLMLGIPFFLLSLYGFLRSSKEELEAFGFFWGILLVTSIILAGYFVSETVNGRIGRSDEILVEISEGVQVGQWGIYRENISPRVPVIFETEEPNQSGYTIRKFRWVYREYVEDKYDPRVSKWILLADESHEELDTKIFWTCSYSLDLWLKKEKLSYQLSSDYLVEPKGGNLVFLTLIWE
ncbi:MAG: hypothetical protein ABIH38_00070 [Patescibacteria group bacterium]